jgi:ferric-dicitrate binding protein FerR (iron transport regulator)
MNTMGAPTGPARAGDAERSQADLLAGLVHELRQPLTGIGAGLRLVEREMGSSVTELEGWKIASAQLTRLAETLETYERLMTPGEIEPGPFAAEAVVRRAVADMRHRLDGFRGELTVAVEGEVPRAHGAPQALHHAVTNVLSNAVDAVEQAGGEGRIEVRVVRAPGPRAQVRVADEGIGVPGAVRARLFSPGVTTKPRGRGMGLGLAVSRRMLRAVGGEVRLAAEDDAARPPWARTEVVIDLAAAADAPAPRAPEPAPGPRLRGSSPGWRGALGVAAVLAILAALVMGSWAGFQRWVRAGESAPAGAEARLRLDRLTVVAVAGTVERFRNGTWLPVAAQEPLSEDDTLRTGEGSRATIAIGERSRVTVSDATQLTVREITTAAQRLRLASGRISVDHQPDGARVLVVESEGGDAIARAGTARFSVLANGASLAIATEAGVVRLQAGGRGVEVGPGEQAFAFGGEAPGPSVAIPVALLLEIGRAAATPDGGCRIEGSVPPGAEVRVDGRRVQPRADGRFSVVLPARRAEPHATVVTRDASGRLVERRVACTQRPQERVSDFAVRWGHE